MAAARLDYVDILRLAFAAGLQDVESARIATAVAMAESHGIPDAQGDTSIQDQTWGPSVGLWQIRSLRAEWGTGRTRDGSRLTDPNFNAKSMITISGGGQNWGPWSAYTNGAYRSHLAMTDAAIESITVRPGVLDLAGNAVDAITPDAITDPITSTVALVGRLVDPSNWRRIAQMVGGLVLLTVALLLIASDLGNGRKPAKPAPKAVAAAAKVIQDTGSATVVPSATPGISVTI